MPDPTLSPEYQKLVTEVTADVSVMSGATTVIGTLADQLRAAVQNATDLQSLQTAISGQADALDAAQLPLAAAIAANTPAAPPAP